MYIDDDIQSPVLTTNILIHGQPIIIPEEHMEYGNSNWRYRINKGRRQTQE